MSPEQEHVAGGFYRCREGSGGAEGRRLGGAMGTGAGKVIWGRIAENLAPGPPKAKRRRE